nr:hypothetical protein [Tanacetum cinerariifolium]GEY26070.1 hypothetical protein [Tanacetum cinerariifolium]
MIKECSSYGDLYNKSCGCSKGGFIDKFVHDPNKTPESSQRPTHNCRKCGNPIDGLYCRQCALLRKKLKEVWFTICDENGIFQDFLNTSESSNDNTNIVNAPQEPFVYSQDSCYEQNFVDNSQSPSQTQYETYPCKLCGNDSHYGYDCPPQFSHVYEQESSYNQNNNDNCYPHNSSSFLCCENCRGPHHAQPEDTHELLRKLLEDLKIINEELAEYINSICWNRPAFYDDDDDEYSIQVSEKSPIAIAPVLPTEELENSLSMGDEHLGTILETKSNQVIKSSVEDLVPIPSESEGILDNMRDVPFSDKNHFDAKSDLIESLLTRDTLIVYYLKINSLLEEFAGDSFKDIDYVEASPPDFELVSLKEVKDAILRAKLLNIHHLIDKIESLNNNPTPDCVLKSPFPFFLSYSDNSMPEFETFSDYTEETSSGSTTTQADNSLPEYDSFLFEIEPDQGEFSSVAMKAILGEPRVYVPNVLPTHPTLYQDSDFSSSDDSLGSGLEVSFPSGTRNKIFDPGIFIEVQSERLLSRAEFSISFIRDPLYPVFDTLISFSFENKDKVFKHGILSYLLISHRDKTTSDFFKNPMMMYGGDIPLLDVLYLHFYPP